MKIEDRLIHLSELLELIGVSRSTIDRWVKAGAFPLPIQLSPEQDQKKGVKPNLRKAWRGDEVKEWIDTRPRVGVVFQEVELTKQLNEVFKR
ncbi:helix-turn-helix transcriptional regulator [Photobacterium atrarenae]|uniref:AlpA family phage regulatory protein n=1 Tax=Photobacterium atrarenae TaxID=865757 RepID=A0ABY5GD97_9GAMM|nr:AlpA family phage regulatory protein [Photobacterium atrarenae]UTV27214.1 AlpA family phage regulatory protein [Photobacterium atrarenae]